VAEGPSRNLWGWTDRRMRLYRKLLERKRAEYWLDLAVRQGRHLSSMRSSYRSRMKARRRRG
jgi:hypothetical protein